MSIEFEAIKSSIDDLDFELNGSLWTIGGSVDVPAIKESSVVEFNNTYQSVVELSVMTKDFPVDVGVDSVAIDQDSEEAYSIVKILPEIDGQLTAWIKLR